MGCIKYILGIVGLVALIVGIGLLVFLHGPQWFNTETRELGGASTTQQALADQTFGSTYSGDNPPDLPVSVDGQLATTNILNTSPEIEGAALSDISQMDSSEAAAEAVVAENQRETLSEVQSFQTSSFEDQQVANLSVEKNAVVTADTEVELVPLNTQNAPAPQTTLGQGGAGGVTGVEQRLVELEFPSSFHVAGSGSVRLTLKALPSGEIEVVPEIEDNAIIATPILISDLYETHTAQFTAHLVAPAFDVKGVSPATQSISRGQQATWRWNLGSPENSGSFVITLGIDLTWVPRTGGSQVGPQPIWGQALQVDNNYVFGNFTVPQASLGGSVLAVIGFVIQIPLISEISSAIWKFLFGRRRKKSEQRRR